MSDTIDEVRTAPATFYLLLGLSLILAFVLGGWILGSEIKQTKLADRYVSVRGLSERTVKADLALWNLQFKESGDNLSTVFAKSEQDKAETLKFLAAQGLAQDEVTIGQARVVDRLANEYGGTEKGPRYIVEQTIDVRSSKVDAVAAAQQKASSLVEQGIILESTQGVPSVQYNFAGLNAIKPDMISEATKNARAAADRFAADSGSRVGSIRRAEQGAFSITGANGDSVAGENGASDNGNASLTKKIRVVTTVDYYLER